MANLPPRGLQRLPFPGTFHTHSISSSQWSAGVKGMVRDGRSTKIRLRKDLTRDIKRGHAWLYSHAVDSAPASAGDVVEVMDRRGDRVIASGIYHPNHALSVRICRTQAPFTLDDQWLIESLQRSIQRRIDFF